jgi:hypothetical protein
MVKKAGLKHEEFQVLKGEVSPSLHTGPDELSGPVFRYPLYADKRKCSSMIPAPSVAVFSF